MDGCGDATCKPPVCQYPAPPPKRIADAGVKCCEFPSETCRVSFELPQDPAFAIDCKQPITVEWPPQKQEVVEYEDTGPRPDLLALIPDQIVPQVVTTVMATPNVHPGSGPTMTHEKINHPLCPDAQFHMRIDPTQKKPREIRMPEQKCPVRGPPCREWIQCVENTLITDQVRRPLARMCHKRPLPPLVISHEKLQELVLKSTEMDRKRAEHQRWHQERECQRLQSRQRQAKWNYTVESLLERKREKEIAKEEGEKEATRQLMEEVKQEKKANSDAQIARAKQLMLYRKGLIRDFHSALAYSKMMQEIENAKSQSKCEDDSSCPQFMQKCTRKMMYPNTSRPDYPAQEKPKKPINQKLLASLQKVECRAKQQEQEINQELCCIKQMLTENLPELPESYKKYIAEPICDDNKKANDRMKYRCELYDSISDKLAADAYIESHENEIDRQACEFLVYRREIDAIRKAKEKQLIDDKVAYNIRKSEEAAAVLVEMQKEKKKRANEYDSLKEQWESEWLDKIEEEKKLKDRKMERVISDFNNRKCTEGWKRCELDPARQWARERLVAVENEAKECEEQTERRKKAEDVALFNKAQASAKHCHENRKRYMDDLWGQKMKQEYLNEMKEMKAYASDCIQDWKTKGRSTFPMTHAMKKWDYDSGMYPYLFADGDVNRQQTQRIAQSAKSANCPKYETTSKRLGFNSGGC